MFYPYCREPIFGIAIGDAMFDCPPGFTAAPKMLENAEPPALITPLVLDLLLTKTAIIATPMIAAITVNTELMRESDIMLVLRFVGLDTGAEQLVLQRSTLPVLRVHCY